MCIAIVDCNNFYVSCERIFQPRLENVPVAILSNNDGCVIARSNEVKKLGVPMGAPYFQYKELFKKHGVKIFSSNYSLYGDISSRVMRTLEELSPSIEIYSIDEAFLDLSLAINPKEKAKEIKSIIRKWIGIPVSIGIASTKTLAKAANKIAKKDSSYEGVFEIDKSNVDCSLEELSLSDIWGIGRRWEKRLHEKGIYTPLQLKKRDPKEVQKILSVVGERTVLELNGIPCIDTLLEKRKSLCVSRSFPQPLEELQEIEEALSCHASRAAEKLRNDSLMANGLMVFLHNSLHGKEEIFYKKAQALFPYPTDFTPQLVNYAVSALHKIYQKGPRFTKVGVYLLDLQNRRDSAYDLFDRTDYEKKRRFSKTLDQINQRYGKASLQSARALGSRRWKMKREHKSPHYTTRWSDLLRVNSRYE